MYIVCSRCSLELRHVPVTAFAAVFGQNLTIQGDGRLARRCHCRWSCVPAGDSQETQKGDQGAVFAC